MIGFLRRHYPFNGEQTVNIVGEFGPLVTMFVVNALIDIQAGTWALIISTVLAMIAMLMVIGRLPVFPFIAGGVTIGFGFLTIVTGDPMWVQIKVTIFNFLFAVVLWIGMYTGHNFFKFVFGKTFHYTDEGWRKFTNNFAWFFVFTAVINEAVRQGFSSSQNFSIAGHEMDGVQVWILFKIFVVMPVSGLFAWCQTRVMQRYRADPPAVLDAAAVPPFHGAAAPGRGEGAASTAAQAAVTTKPTPGPAL